MEVLPVNMGIRHVSCLSADELKSFESRCAKELKELTKRKNKTKLVVDYTNEDTAKLIMIHRRQEELTSLRESVEKRIKEVEEEIDSLQDEISDEIIETIRTTNRMSEKKQEEIKKAVKKVIGLYTDSKGSITKEQAQTMLSKEIGSINTFLPSVIAKSLYNTSGRITDLKIKINLMTNLSIYEGSIVSELNQNNAVLGKYYNMRSDLGYDYDFSNSFVSNPIALNKIKILGETIRLGSLSSMNTTAKSVESAEEFELRKARNNGLYDIKHSKEYENKDAYQTG